jgi:hypothetical protein
MSNEQQELLDEAYKNYKRLTHKINEKNHYGEYSKWGDAPLISGVQHLTKDSFIQMIKINSEFSEKWRLQIEERELSLDERGDIYETNFKGLKRNKSNEDFDKINIPTKLITITYNDKTIESYEN